MTSLLTWSQYATIFGLEDDDPSRSVVEAVIPSVSANVERLCDRSFNSAIRVEWRVGRDEAWDGRIVNRMSGWDSTWLAYDYPVIKILGSYSMADGFSITNNGATDIEVSWSGKELSISDAVTLSSTSAAAASYATLTLACDELSTSDVVLSPILPDATNLLLCVKTGVSVPAGQTKNFPMGKPTDSHLIALDEHRMVSSGMMPEGVAYLGGYDPLPDDLVQAVAICVRQVTKMIEEDVEVTPGMASETISKYSYRITDGACVAAVVFENEKLFAAYRRPIFG